MTEDEVRKLLLRRAKPYRKYRGTTGVSAWCDAHGVAKTHVSDFMNGRRRPMADLLDALGLEWRIMRKSAPPRR